MNKVTYNASKAPAANKDKVEEKDAATDGAANAEDKKADAVKPSTGSSPASSASGLFVPPSVLLHLVRMSCRILPA